MGFEEEHGVGLGLGFEEEHDVGLDLGFECHFTHLWYVSFVFYNPLLLKSGINRYFCSNFMSLSSQKKKKGH